jgi:hypothetical protein
MRTKKWIPATGVALLIFAAALPAQKQRPGRGQKDNGRPLHSLEITVEDMATGQFLQSLRRGDTVVIRPGQQVRLRMTGNTGPNARYPSTHFTPNDSRNVRVDKINPEVGTIIVTGMQATPGPGAFVIQYQVTDSMPIANDRERTGRVYVRVEDLAPPPPPPGSPQGDRFGVTLFTDEQFRGRSQTFYENDQDLRDNPIQSDSVSSVRVDPGCRAVLYEDANFRGRSALIERDAPNFRDLGIGNDSLSSLEVECGRTNRGIIVFEDAGFRGRSEALGEGDYAELSGGVGNDRISSIQVDRGCRAVLFADAGFRGRSWTIEQDASSLDGSPVGNDSISSIQVICGR